MYIYIYVYVCMYACIEGGRQGEGCVRVCIKEMHVSMCTWLFRAALGCSWPLLIALGC